MEDQWLRWAKRLEALSTTGQHFTKDAFDHERYSEMQGIARSMLSALGNVPLSRIDNLVSSSANGYVTPKVDVRGAIIRKGEILLVKEKADGLWTLPGGFADIGLSPSENILKEIEEEAGIVAEVVGLYSVRHKAKQAYEPDLRDFYKLFFLCQQVNDDVPAASGETSAAGYFDQDNLPPLSEGRVIKSDIDAAFDYAENQLSVLVD
ncbi:NUDIX hydrolase [Parasphingorhabdus cellanae]|uniref:NUDIX hydrolase n=1 Tax=Parasphingorhabdus cellanae TaxID=2806553 RepID=A0ABX7T4H6_9SPHN|nr:NUDIX hydrolase [Parasphingorhabdus cellanae]QTD55818.1 NUDIX hydrolase [Parasphingorhabdus cellanae]